MPADDIDRLRKDYEKACVAAMDEFLDQMGPDGMENYSEKNGLDRAAFHARSSLQAALARQQKAGEDEEMIAFMVPLLLRPSIATEREQDMIHKVRHLLSALKAAGFSLRKDAT